MSKADEKPDIGTWKGEKQYRCRLCPFDTLDEAVFVDHFARVHAPLRVIDGGKKAVTKEATAQERTAEKKEN